ncbi:alpha/beta hydrolase [Scandinavium sp. H11S7]|uniref:alpha/beta fold hydrolase n=1 Tax=Scandinavium TaxID=2726810 RepID=UPI00135AE00A|nr:MULTISPECIES: alpha/beta hydrolase [Scandinavium]MCS2146785.1 alpha/beta hydrolase [Scandinavium manionii]MCS2155424.1 alpha/beta hydrolase [Scandinavium hiltneri]MCS2168785.1 alpha/beta hydrolase [Scandinavium tedordense]
MKHPILLLPGTLCDHRLWGAQLAALSVIAQPQVMDVGFADSMEALAAKILDISPPRFALAGFSFGGILAFELWRQAPHRITHLALIDTNARPDPLANRSMRAEQLHAAQGMGVGLFVRKQLLPHYLYKSHQNSSVENTIVSMAEEVGLAIFKRQILAVQHRVDSRADLPSINVPTLVTAGTQDHLCPPKLQWEMAENIRDATCELLPQCGHFSPLEEPERISELISTLIKG